MKKNVGIKVTSVTAIIKFPRKLLKHFTDPFQERDKLMGSQVVDCV